MSPERIRFYLDRHEQAEQQELESAFADQLKRSTDHTCALLAKGAADVRAVYFLLGEDDPDALARCRTQALRTISKALSLEEARVSSLMQGQPAQRTEQLMDQQVRKNGELCQ